ncbi:MAG: hypothetical protein IT382_21015 [Deltaproteobacteria bacterium]|nr:hypothetical protein [Deltaproteobacteria bacterium]
MGEKPRGVTAFLDRAEGELLTAHAVSSSGRDTPVTKGEIGVLADAWVRRHVVRHGGYPGPSAVQAPVPTDAVAMDAGAEERLSAFLLQHRAPVGELAAVMREGIQQTLMRVRLGPGTATPPESLAPRTAFVLEDDGQGNARVAHIHHDRQNFILETRSANGSTFLTPLSFTGLDTTNIDSVSRLPQHAAARAVTAATGVPVDLSAATFRRHGGALAVTFTLPGAKFRVVSVRNDDTGADTLASVHVVEQKRLFTVADARRAEQALRTAGVQRPDLRALGAPSQTRGPTSQAMVYSDASGALQAGVLVSTPTGGVSTAPFVFDGDQARALAATLITGCARALADNIGPTGVLEVHARLASLDAATLPEVLPADSPFPYDAATETQYLRERALGDIAIAVTFNRNTGAVRVEST